MVRLATSCLARLCQLANILQHRAMAFWFSTTQRLDTGDILLIETLLIVPSSSDQRVCLSIHGACAGSSELAAVGVALSIFGTVTKLLNIPLLSVTTNIVATAVGTNKGDHAPTAQQECRMLRVSDGPGE